ncbi:MAG: autotransporter domain-containing protein [Pseudomonas sp.]
MTGLLLMAVVPTTYAANCKAPGGLVFLGKNSDLTRSVWLSGTGTGSFALQAPDNTAVDTWSRSRRGLHISLSPVVSQGSGLPHTLVDVTNVPCEIDMKNQKGGIVFPPLVQLPPKLPPVLKPPSERPSLPGLMPTFPSGGFSVLPGSPGGIAPPMGNLPSGLTPSRPSLGGGLSRPSGVTPSVPIGVQPPVAGLPPSGLTPSVPSTVAPPLGTLPPSGLTPSVPMGVQPPVAGLPPGTITPSVPGAVIPPVGGAAPGLPEGVQHPGSNLPSLDGSVVSEGLNIDGNAPLTEGRKFEQEPLWNVWADSRYSDIRDRRSGLDVDGYSGYVTIGADRRINSDMVVGMMTIFERNRSDGFDGDWTVRSDGISAGPYAAYRLSPNWTLDGSLSIGSLDNDNHIAVLDERYTTQRYALAMSATGQYVVNETVLTPKLSLSYTHFRSEEHEMTGNIAGIPIELAIEQQNFDYGVAETSLKLTRTYRSNGGKYWYPYAEFGVSNEFERPNDGNILTGDLSQEKTSPWSGTVRTGVMSMLSPNMFVETSLGYLSLGQNGLDIWEGRVFMSVAF